MTTVEDYLQSARVSLMDISRRLSQLEACLPMKGADIAAQAIDMHLNHAACLIAEVNITPMITQP